VEAAPNYELARRVLNEAATGIVESFASPSGPIPREGRAIIGSDDRYIDGNPTAVYGSTVAMSESGGSGALIGPRSLYTAAHTVYNTFTNGWICKNNSTSNSANPCDGPGEPGDGRWRFPGGLISCGAQTWITNGFVNLGTPSTDAQWWTLARWDYAIVDFTGCSPGNSFSWLGVANLSNSDMSGKSVWTAGYPTRYWCPSGAVGTASDCPTVSATGQGAIYLTPDETTRPYTGGTLFWQGPGSAQQGDSSSSDTWKGIVDIVPGMSGGPLVLWWAPTSSWTTVGVASNTTGGANPVNRYNRMTTEVWNFFDGNNW
jgi:V8-like Glu-specific endopeptidase